MPGSALLSNRALNDAFLPVKDYLRKVKFERLSIEQGLSQSIVKVIFQDSRGFMWFGTQDGLNRYDGYHFIVYRSDPRDSTTLSHKSIVQISEDLWGNLWIFTENGLNKFNRETETFTRYLHDPNDLNSISSNHHRCVLQDRDGAIWFGTSDGLNRYNRETDDFTRFLHKPDNEFNASSNTILQLYEDREGMLWIGTADGLSRYDKQTGEFKRFFSEPGDRYSITNNIILEIFEDRSGDIWIGTANGLNVFDRNTGVFKHFFHDSGDPLSISHNTIWEIYEDSTGVLWIRTPGGLNRYGKKSGAFTSFTYDETDSTSISDNIISKIYEDHTGTLWVGTFNGLNRYNKTDKSFTCFKHHVKDTNGIIDNSVQTILEDKLGYLWVPGNKRTQLSRLDPRTGEYSTFRVDPSDPYGLSGSRLAGSGAFYEDRSGVLWIGTEGGGVNKFDPWKRKFIHIYNDFHGPDNLAENMVWTVYEDRQGIAWIGTNERGLDRLVLETGEFTHYQYNPDDPRSISHNHVTALLEDRYGVLWVGTMRGLNRMDRETGDFFLYQNKSEGLFSISDDYITAIMEDSRGYLWIGTHRGLSRLNRKTGQFTRFPNKQGTPYNIANNHIRQMLEDSNGDLWLATMGGLNKFNRADGSFSRYEIRPGDSSNKSDNNIFSMFIEDTGKDPSTLWLGTNAGLYRFDPGTSYFTHFGVKDGLPNEVVYGILSDSSANLWLSTNHGLSRFSIKTRTFRNYDISDGLQSNEFSQNAFCKGRSGRMYFGGINGLTLFYPDEVKDNPHAPQMVITGFKIFNRPVTVGKEEEGMPYWSKSITETESIRLSHAHSSFSIEFAALHYSSPGKNRYAYKMEGYDKHWVDAGTRRFVTYTNLEHGQYVFHVRGANCDGVWNMKGVSLQIFIEPPLWKKWWFRSLAVIVATGMFILWYRGRLRNTHLKAELMAARDAQMSIMPNRDPVLQEYDISGVCIPAYEVGGDFFDYIWLNEKKTKFGIVIGDVSGKAMKAAMTAIMTSGMIFLKASENMSIKETMTQVNRPLYFKTDKKMFTALCMVSLDIDTRELVFTNAGLTEPLMKRGSIVDYIHGEGPRFPLGIIKNNQYKERSFQLEKGDVMVLFTDGIMDSQTPDGEFYGDAALIQLLKNKETRRLSAREIKDSIIDEVKHFSRGAPQNDDITLVVVKVV